MSLSFSLRIVGNAFAERVAALRENIAGVGQLLADEAFEVIFDELCRIW